MVEVMVAPVVVVDVLVEAGWVTVQVTTIPGGVTVRLIVLAGN